MPCPTAIPLQRGRRRRRLETDHPVANAPCAPVGALVLCDAGTRGCAPLHPGLSTSAPVGPRAGVSFRHAEGMDIDSPGWSDA